MKKIEIADAKIMITIRTSHVEPSITDSLLKYDGHYLHHPSNDVSAEINSDFVSIFNEWIETKHGDEIRVSSITNNFDVLIDFSTTTTEREMQSVWFIYAKKIREKSYVDDFSAMLYGAFEYFKAFMI